MLRQIEQDLSLETIAHLASLQAKVDAAIGFEAQAELADRLWRAKENSHAGKTAFAEIKERLIKMSVGRKLCNYCEQNEGSDIEHIAPKSLFPHLAFVWSNYLLACKHCNTGYKLDAMYVFHPSGSAITVFAKRGLNPPSQDIAYIQPRVEDPMDLMELDIWDEKGSGTFEFFPRKIHRLGTRENEKVMRTLEILGMDENRSLHYLREQAFKNFKNSLAVYVNVSLAQTHAQINQATQDIPAADTGKPFADEQQRILNSIKDDILHAAHPTVWLEMIRQCYLLPQKLQELIAAAPALIEASRRMA